MEAKKYNIDLQGKNKEELAIIEEILQRLNIPFKADSSPYKDEFIKKMEQGGKQPIQKIQKYRRFKKTLEFGQCLKS